MAAEPVELHKLKLAELKQECLARGLEAKGNKQDLINRLQAYLEEHAEEEANEEDVLGEEIEEEEQKPAEPPVKAEEPPVKPPDVNTEKKVVKITSEISQMERMQKRAERFNVPVSLESKKAARAARFGLATVSTKGLSADSKPTVNMDKLKERAQRFGLNVSSLSKKSEEDEKLKKRKERFGIVTSSAGAGATEDTEVKSPSREDGQRPPQESCCSPSSCSPWPGCFWALCSLRIKPQRPRSIMRTEILTPFPAFLLRALFRPLGGSLFCAFGPSFKFVTTSGHFCAVLGFHSVLSHPTHELVHL